MVHSRFNESLEMNIKVIHRVTARRTQLLSFFTFGTTPEFGHTGLSSRKSLSLLTGKYILARIEKDFIENSLLIN